MVEILLTLTTLLAILAILAIWGDRQLLNPDNSAQTTELLQNQAIRDQTANFEASRA